jgi:hypothetical protein
MTRPPEKRGEEANLIASPGERVQRIFAAGAAKIGAAR